MKKKKGRKAMAPPSLEGPQTMGGPKFGAMQTPARVAKTRKFGGGRRMSGKR